MTPAKQTLVLFRCRRCSELVTETHPDADVALRRALESGMPLTVHGCSDGASGVAEVIGTGPGRPWEAKAEATP